MRATVLVVKRMPFFAAIASPSELRQNLARRCAAARVART
jgi:hypothetical protein